MPITYPGRLGLPNWGAGSDPFTRAQMNEANADAEALVAIDAQAASNPAPGVQGKYFWNTTTSTLYRDDGVSLFALPSLLATAAQQFAGNLQSKGADSRFGAGVGGTGSFLRIGDQGDTTNGYVMADGSGANIGMVFRTKGSGIYTFQNVDGTVTALTVNPSTKNIQGYGADNRLGVGVSGSGPYLRLGDLGDPVNTYVVADGSGANVGMGYRIKGSGTHSFQDAVGAELVGINSTGGITGQSTLHLKGTAHLGAGGVTGSGPYLRLGDLGETDYGMIDAAGSGANVGIKYRTKGTGLHRFLSAAGDTLLDINPTTKNLNAYGTNHAFGAGASGSGAYLRIGDQGDTTTGYVIADGSGADINLGYRIKGTGNHSFQNAAGAELMNINSSGGVRIQSTLHVKGTANLGLGGLTTGTYLQIGDLGDSFWTYIVAAGTEANIGIKYRTKGTAAHTFQDASGNNLATINPSTKNLAVYGSNNTFGTGVSGTGAYLKIGDQGDSTTGYIIADGSASNVSLTLRPKGTTGSIKFQTGGGVALAEILSAGSMRLGGSVSLPTDTVVFGLPSIGTAVSGTPTSGGWLWVQNGALKYKGTSGTETTLANA